MTYINLFRHEGHNFDEWLEALLKTENLKGKKKASRLAYIRRLNHRFVERLVARAELITTQIVENKSDNALTSDASHHPNVPPQKNDYND